MSNVVLSVFFVFNIFIKAHDPLGNDVSGDRQIGEVNIFLKKPLAVRVLDETYKPISNATVVFAVLNEPDENLILKKFTGLESDTVKTDVDGYAMTRLRFGGGKGNYYILAQYNSESLIFNLIALEKNWFLFLLCSLLGGLALFVFGLNYGSKGLIRSAGYKMRDLLFSLTTNRFSALITGIIVTIILGSSTATAVLLVRFVSTGIIGLLPALGVILGADIGTSITVQILAFNILNYAILIVAIGVFLRLLFPDLRNIAQFILGIGLLFFALKIMSSAAGNLKYLPNFYAIVNSLGNYPVIGILIGSLVAFVFHSSAATIGVVLILSFESLITLPAALPLVLGANLGTTFSTLLASDTANGRQVAFGHFIFKLSTIVIFLPFLVYIGKLISCLGGDVARQVANFHTIFNICTAIIFGPLLNQISLLLKSIIKETKKELLRIKRLDPAFLITPAIALGQATKEILYMADTTIKMLEDSIKVFGNKDIVLRKKIIETDDEIDAMEEAITPYLSQISQEEMDDKLSRLHKGLLSAVSNLEHIGDIISKSLMNYAKKQIDSGLVFSTEGFSQLKEFHAFVLISLRMAVNSLATHDKKLASEAVKRHEIALHKAKEYEVDHLARLSRGLKESLETSTIHLDIISDLERINFHASEVGKTIL